MFVTHVELKDFRNYETLGLELSLGPTLIVGSNGQGKTNLVEALGFLSTLGSHRVSTDHAMVRQNMDAAIIRVRVEHNERKFLAEVQINRTGANRAQINRSAIRTRELPRYFSSVLFAPEDLALVRGEPSGRRRFIDDLLILRSPRFSGVMSDYERVVKQRNMLLKSARASGVRDRQLSTLDVWDERLVEFGAEIISARSALVADLSPEVSQAYERIVGADHGASLANSLSIISRQDDSDSAIATNEVGEVISVADATVAFTSSLESVHRAERDRAITLVGPHRDDLIFGLNGLPARGYASHGESWSFALALKLASAELLRRESSAGDPVLILDDVFAELDQSRRERLAASISNFEQVLITAAVFGDVPESLAANVIQIRAGEVVTNE
jgi:DNA replication and repair protein RecF